MSRPRYGRYYDEPKKTRQPVVIIFALIALLAVLVFAISATCAKASGSKKGTLTVGTNTPFPPFEIRKGEEVIGFDIDLAKRIADALGRKLIVKDFSEFDALLPSVAEGESLDMAISSITIREDRKEVVSFSEPYFDSAQAVLAAKGVSFNYAGPASLKSVKVGYQEGTTSQSWLEDNLGKGGPNLVSFGDVSIGLQMLFSGSIDVVIVDAPVAENFAKTKPGLKVAGRIETGEQYGVVVAKDDPKKLLKAVNEIIKEIKQNGEYDQLVQKWFGGAK